MDLKTLVNPVGYDSVLDIADPTTTLTKRERLIVQQTWSNVCQLGKSTVALELFDLFFKRNPSYVKLFKAFDGIPVEKLKAHPKLKAHGVAVIHAVSSVVENLDDPETVVCILTKIGRDHIRREIKAEHFEELKNTIMVLLEHVLKSEFAPVVKESWNKALSVVMSVVKTAMNQSEINQV